MFILDIVIITFWISTRHWLNEKHTSHSNIKRPSKRLKSIIFFLNNNNSLLRKMLGNLYSESERYKSHILCNRRALIELSDKYENDIMTFNDYNIDLINNSLMVYTVKIVHDL